MKTHISQYIAEMSNFPNLAAEGELITKLTPDIIDFTASKNIVNQQDSSKSLLFFKDPTYLYGPATIAFVDILVQDSIIHFVLDYPVIFDKNVMPLYSLNNKCHLHRDLIICATYKHLLKSSCINKTTINCTYSAGTCTSPFNISLPTMRGNLGKEYNRVYTRSP